MKTYTLNTYTIDDIDSIAKAATERIAADFKECGFNNPPVVTSGIANAVLDAAQEHDPTASRASGAQQKGEAE